MMKQNLLRRPNSSSNLPSECDEVWGEFRGKVLSLEKSNYISCGKALATELQLCMQKNRGDIKKVVHIVYQRALKDIHGYPIAALLFEDMGEEAEGFLGGQSILDELQKQIQKSLSSLNAKLGRKENIEGSDVGIIFLLFVLYKLEILRQGDGLFFKDLLLKLFEKFHVYMFGTGNWPQSDICVTVINAICVLVNIASNDVKTKVKINQTLDLLRKVYIQGCLSEIAKVQILWTTECFWSSQASTNSNNISNNLRDEYRIKYETAYKKENLLDSPEHGKRRSFSNQSLKSSNPRSDEKEIAGDRIIEQGVEVGPNIVEESTFAKRNLKESVSSAELRQLIENGVKANQNGKTEMCENVKVPDDCIQRIYGYEGAILRKLEFESGAKIYIDIDKILRCEYERPETTSLTAHRLVAAALGVRTQIDEEKSKVGKEKLARAKELASIYKSTKYQHDVKITGSVEAVSMAKKLINEIINITTFLSIPLPGFTIDEVLEIAGTKLATVETLVNVVLRLEELDDESVVLHISGDEKSCEDAKKLILGELGEVTAINGQLMLLPQTLRSVLTTKDDLNSYVDKLVELSGARIRILTDDQCFFLFLAGYPNRVCKARAIMNKINTHLLFTSKSLPDVLEVMEGISRKDSLTRQGSHSDDPSSPVGRKIPQSYSRDALVHYSSSPASWQFPNALRAILDGDDSICKLIVVEQGIDMKELLSLTRNDPSPRIRPLVL